MASNIIKTTSPQIGIGNNTTNTHFSSSAHTHVHHGIPPNPSVPYGCSEIILLEDEHQLSGSHHDLVSSEAEALLREIKDFLLAFFFLIGGPANVINMAVFYKQGLKDRVNLCLFALSLADELHLIMGLLHHGEQLVLRFSTKDTFGPVDTFLSNHNLLGLMGFNFISYILSAIIATERCLCILNPLKFQLLLRTRTMAVIIAVTYVLVLSLYFIVATRHRVGCVYNPASGAVDTTGIIGEFYKNNKQFIDSLDSYVFGTGVPGVVMIAVITTTTLTVLKLRQIKTWRAEVAASISPREVALTKLLVGNSILFIVCLSPVALIRITWLFLPVLTTGHENVNFFQTTLWITELFTFINASLNIFVYYTMGSRYRETLWALLGRERKVTESESG